MNAHIDAVRVAGTPSGPVPVVLLAPDSEPDLLPIFIGFDEAAAIARGLDAVDIGRPLTHDLLLDVVEELGGRVDKVVVDSLESEGEGGTYTADLHLDTPRGTTVVDARPSDSLALAARTGADIEIDPGVYDEGRRERTTFDDLDDIREVADL
ncbi:bifunctional nuclease family protein [Halococcus sp. IIIV-5B]|uniref:bifunctional nuclease family protein n=1 Tax=Halococcus sp. IIIV-5B TaxID=2321230 RepID=UPI000E715C2A|nr:bifunctional nuclease domain-containing protein [Halococcus sp. IIIV-5B]RJT06858.1 bifunctional nuclease family protein [Halococcus sp. IIIV-5B]